MLLPLQILIQYRLPLCVFEASAAQLGCCTGHSRSPAQPLAALAGPCNT